MSALLHSLFSIPLAILALIFCCCALLLYINDNLPRPRLSGWSVLAALLVTAIGYIAPQNLPVVLYKISLVVIGGVLGYWLDRGLFPYARPHNQCNDFHGPAQSMACLRRALIVIACVLGLTMGL